MTVADLEEHKSTLAASYLALSPVNFTDRVDTTALSEQKLSPWVELPQSPETFCHITNYELRGETTCDCPPWQQQSPLTDSASSQGSVVISGQCVVPSNSVSKCELTAEDMLLDLDEVIRDIVMDPLEIGGIGLYLPPVSADDVDSLLSSPSITSGLSAADSVSSDVDPTPIASNSYLLCQEQAASPLAIVEVKPFSLSEAGFAVYHELVEAKSPYSPASETGLSASQEPIQVPSPASSLFSVSTQSSDTSSVVTQMSERRRRKKQQNKTAAQKYRQKKRGEQGVVMTECEQLERKNIELRTRVEEMTREVNYLKGLIEEICA